MLKRFKYGRSQKMRERESDLEVFVLIKEQDLKCDL